MLPVQVALDDVVEVGAELPPDFFGVGGALAVGFVEIVQLVAGAFDVVDKAEGEKSVGTVGQQFLFVLVLPGLRIPVKRIAFPLRCE